MPEAALRAEPDGLALVFAVLAGTPPTTAVAVVEAGVVGKMILAVAVPVIVPLPVPVLVIMDPPPEVLVGGKVVVVEPVPDFLSTILKLAQAIRVLLA